MSEALSGVAAFFAGVADESAANGFAVNRLDRHLNGRGPDAIAKALGDRAAAIYLFTEDQVVLKRGANGFDPLFSMDELQSLQVDVARTVLLGWWDDAPVWPRRSAPSPWTTPASRPPISGRLRSTARSRQTISAPWRRGEA